MRIFVLICLAFILCSSYATTQETIYLGKLTVGKRPVAIYGDTWDEEYGLYVLCAGYDSNNDGIKDEGDEPMSIWHIPYKAYIYVLMDIDTFDFTIGQPYKLIDLEFRTEYLPIIPFLISEDYGTIVKIYIAGSDGVNEITCAKSKYGFEDTILATKKQIVDLVPTAISYGLSRWNSKRLYLSMNPEKDEPGYVLIYDMDSKTYWDTIPAYQNVGMTIPIEKERLLILNAGSKVQNDSRIQMVDFSGTVGPDKHYVTEDIEVGIGGNYIYFTDSEYGYYRDFCAVTCFEEGDIKFGKNFELDSLDIQTYPEFRPREIHNNYITSYDGWIYNVNFFGKSISPYVFADGKAEGLYSDGFILAIATPYPIDSYEPDSTITLYAYEPVSVEANKEKSGIELSPNPASDYIEINNVLLSEANHPVVKVFDVLGLEKSTSVNFVDTSASGGHVRIDVSSLSPGVYFVSVDGWMYKFVKI